MATAPAFVTLSNGEKLAIGVYHAFLAMQAAALRDTGYVLTVSSGYRTHAEQVSIFTARYRQQAAGNGAYNDVRWWNGAAYGYPGGTRWVRVSGAGTVAVPGTSLHEKASAVDFSYPANISTSSLSVWLRRWAATFGFSPSGYGFGEPWHYDYTGNPWAGGDPTPIPPPDPEEEDDDMAKMKGASYANSAGTTVYMLFNEESGFYVEHSGVTGGYNNTIAKNWETNSWSPITEGHAKVIKAALDRVRKGE